MRLNLNDYTPGETIKIIREWTELTQEQFGRRIGKSRRTIQQYEAGTINYSFQLLLQIATMFHVTLIASKKETK